MGYPDVQRFCEEWGGSPVTIESEAKNNLMLRSFCPRGDFCYIGLLGDFTGTSYWPSGAPLNFTNLVPRQTSLFPFWEHSTSTTYVVTLLSNMPEHATGCDVRYTVTFRGGKAAFADVAVELAFPACAVLWSALLWVQRRPSSQHQASSLLRAQVLVNFIWAFRGIMNSCFVDDFGMHLTLTHMGKHLVAAGFGGNSALGLWLVVRRMCVLYPPGPFKRLFWGSVASFSVSSLVGTVFFDLASPYAPTAPVLIGMFACVMTCASYLGIAILSFFHLYLTWEHLQKEAASGCSVQSVGLMAQVRAAKLHLIAVPLAVSTGAIRWAMSAFYIGADIYRALPRQTVEYMYLPAMFLDTMTNDFCVHVLAALNMDEAVVRARKVTTEIAERAEVEVGQHRLAVRMLKAAPTSLEQMRQLARLEAEAVAAIGSEDEAGAFLVLQSAVRSETARIHRLMRCVRIRAMTMRVRYQYLIEVQELEGAPRQHVPEKLATGEKSPAKAGEYLDWLYAEADGAQRALFREMRRLVATFNRAVWPNELGLAAEEFPWRIWVGSNYREADGRKGRQGGEAFGPGDTVLHSQGSGCCCSQDPSLCIVLEQVSIDSTLIHRSGMESPEQVHRGDLRACSGGAIFVPGPQKRRQRSLDKVATDYGAAKWPAAASLVDICRCTVLCDDPYAIAVFMAYLRRSVEVLRVKNRFGQDALEPQPAEELQSMFYDGSAAADGASSEGGGARTWQTAPSSSQQYRDVSVNVLIKTPNEVPFVCEVQVTLSNLAILKHADTKLYSIRRMKSAVELSRAHVFNMQESVL